MFHVYTARMKKVCVFSLGRTYRISWVDFLEKRQKENINNDTGSDDGVCVEVCVCVCASISCRLRWSILPDKMTARLSRQVLTFSWKPLTKWTKKKKIGEREKKPGNLWEGDVERIKTGYNEAIDLYFSDQCTQAKWHVMWQKEHAVKTAKIWFPLDHK